MVTVIEPGRLVKVDPDKLDAHDILEFAEVLIEEHGWLQHDSGDTGRGFSLHGAVGEAARRAVTPHSVSTYVSKDNSTGKREDPGARELRDAANELLVAMHGKTDIEINDAASTVDEVLVASRQARGAEPRAI